MRLAEFITQNREPILVEWEAFARTCGPASESMDIEALRDHADAMLSVMAEDLCTPQSKGEQTEKSKGNAPETPERTAAEEHGAGRADSGFTIEQMVSEYRALRASVIRLWTKSLGGHLQTEHLEDLTRFNEAIDQSLAESVTRYSQDLAHSEQMFLAILGHDLRTPLNAVGMSSQFMLDTNELKEPHLTLTGRIVSSAARMNRMIGDLLDFTRSRLGGGIPVERKPMSMESTVHEVVDELAAVYPDRVIEVQVSGPERGEWDCARISQALTNLVGNAIEHGAPGSVVHIAVGGDERELTVAVQNAGLPIPVDQLNGIFNPMKRREMTGGGPSGNLGLGLFIAERIVSAHNGRISVESTPESGTTFTMHLPRAGKA